MDEFSIEIQDSINRIDFQEWNRFIRSDDLSMDPRIISLLEETLRNQARFWIIIIKGPQKQWIAVACLALFHTDIIQSSPLFVQKIIQKLRVYKPNTLKIKVLFCGLPIPAGQSHFRLAASAPTSKILDLLTQTMTKIARQEKAHLIVFKELNDQEKNEVKHLQSKGFFSGELEPLFQFNPEFNNFDEYISALRSGYRRQIQLNMKKFNPLEYRVEHIFNPEEIYQKFTSEVHQLYLNVWHKAKEKLECFPREFFQKLPRALSDRVVFTLIQYKNQPVAFSIGLLSLQSYHNLYVGLDYSHTEKADLYFNLFYQELGLIFTLKKKQIFLGQTSTAFKTRLGAIPDARFFLVKPLNPLLKIIFKYFKNLIMPKIQKLDSNQVFKMGSGL